MDSRQTKRDPQEFLNQLAIVSLLHKTLNLNVECFLKTKEIVYLSIFGNACLGQK